MIRANERDGGRDRLQGAHINSQTGNVAYVSVRGHQQMATKSTIWNEGMEAGKDREKIERRRRRFGAGVSLLSPLKGQIWREEEGIVYCAHLWHLHIGHQLVR